MFISFKGQNRCNRKVLTHNNSFVHFAPVLPKQIIQEDRENSLNLSKEVLNLSKKVLVDEKFLWQSNVVEIFVSQF